jgi:hypothetical protein
MTLRLFSSVESSDDEKRELETVVADGNMNDSSDDGRELEALVEVVDNVGRRSCVGTGARALLGYL